MFSKDKKPKFSFNLTLHFWSAYSFSGFSVPLGNIFTVESMLCHLLFPISESLTLEQEHTLIIHYCINT